MRRPCVLRDRKVVSDGALSPVVEADAAPLLLLTDLLAKARKLEAYLPMQATDLQTASWV